MTEEEKASDIHDICLSKKAISCYRKMGEETCSKCKTYQMYKLGLAKGRKEQEEENAELKKQLEVTNKENERIRRTMLTYSECITEHQNTIKRKDEENAQMKEQNKSTRMEKGILEAKLKTYEALWDEQQRAIKEKSAQINKLKCCGNCKHYVDDNCGTCHNHDGWEMKE